MTESVAARASGLVLTTEQAAEFARLAAAMGSNPAEILGMMVRRAVEMDREMRMLGLRGISHWVSGREAAGVAADHGVHGLPLDIRPSGLMWPAEIPFPWSAEECRAAVIGHEVKWKGGYDFLHRLRGTWEMLDGYAFLRQT